MIKYTGISTKFFLEIIKAIGNAKKLHVISKMFVKNFFSGNFLFKKNKERQSKEIKRDMIKTNLSTRSMVPKSAKRRLKELLKTETR